MAALACVSNFISIATPASRIHIGNAFCVLCGLILGPAYGFFAAGVGNAIFDIIGGYGMEFIITFINKGAIALVTGLIAYKAASKETLEKKDHARIIVGSVLGALTYTALYLLKSYIKLRFTTADVDPAAIQVTMLSRRRAACSTPRLRSSSRRSSSTFCASRCAVLACTARIKPVLPIGFFWPASKAGLFCNHHRLLLRPPRRRGAECGRARSARGEAALRGMGFPAFPASEPDR